MSLDVYLCQLTSHAGYCANCGGRGIEQVYAEVFAGNITHNLGEMADEAGIYQVLWRPEELGITFASEIIPALEAGLSLLRGDPARFQLFNPSNGWGDYERLVSFVDSYLAACRSNPTAKVVASR